MTRTVRPALRGSGSVLATAGVLAVAAIAFPAQAQDQAGAESGDTIIVTAQKRSQDIISVPAAISAIGETQLEAARVTDFSDITRLSPSITVTDGGNSASSTVSMRGIGTFAFSTSVEPSVSIVVDDVALLQQSQAFGPLTDIARIEVLRGPQDTLFGKNASAGVINIVTKNPTRELSGYVEGNKRSRECCLARLVLMQASESTDSIRIAKATSRILQMGAI